MGKVRQQSRTVSGGDGPSEGQQGQGPGAEMSFGGWEGAHCGWRSPDQRKAGERARGRGRRWVTWHLAGHHEDSGFKLTCDAELLKGLSNAVAWDFTKPFWTVEGRTREEAPAGFGREQVVAWARLATVRCAKCSA